MNNWGYIFNIIGTKKSTWESKALERTEIGDNNITVTYNIQCYIYTISSSFIIEYTYRS